MKIHFLTKTSNSNFFYDIKLYFRFSIIIIASLRWGLIIIYLFIVIGEKKYENI